MGNTAGHFQLFWNAELPFYYLFIILFFVAILLLLYLCSRESTGKTMKQSVKLRQRVMPSGNVSLYLDIYVKGVRNYEYLHLYLHPGRDRATKEQNRQTLQLAEAICAKRLVEVRNGQYGFKSPVAVSLHQYVNNHS